MKQITPFCHLVLALKLLSSNWLQILRDAMFSMELPVFLSVDVNIIFII